MVSARTRCIRLAVAVSVALHRRCVLCQRRPRSLIVERGQPGGLTGRLQSVHWAAIYTASVLTGVAGGYLSAIGCMTSPFCFVVWAGWRCWRSARLYPRATTACYVGRCGHCHPKLAGHAPFAVLRSVCLFCFLFHFNPFSTTVLYLHMTTDLRFSEEFYGLTNSIVAVASVLACVTFGLYSQRLSLRKLVHLSMGWGY